MPGAQPLPEPILTGTKAEMEAVPPYDSSTKEGSQHGQLFVTERDIFRYDGTLLSDGGLIGGNPYEFDGDETPQNTNAVDSIRPLVPEQPPSGSGAPAYAGRWKSLVQTRGYIDAERVFGVQSGDVEAVANSAALRECIQEAMKIGRHRVLLPEGEIPLDPRENDNPLGLPVAFEFLTEVDFWNTAGQTPYTEQDIIGGRVILMGHGPGGTRLSPRGNRTIGEGTTLVNVGSAGSGRDAFLVGGSRTYQSFGRVVHLVLQDLALSANTNTNNAVLRLDQPWGGHFLRWIHVRQTGFGNGIDANNLWLGRFNDIVVSRAQPISGEIELDKMDVTTLSDSDFQGVGFWMRTTLDDINANEVFVSGEFILHRLSAFGPWKTGILFGDPQRDPVYGVDDSRILAGISGQFINAEKCYEGVVVGSKTHDIDLSVVWTEKSRRCGTRIYNGARNVSIRRAYSVNEPPESDVSNGYEGDIVLGLTTLSPEDPIGDHIDQAVSFACDGVLLDGITQHKIHGPAVDISASVRNVTIRDVQVITLPNNGVVGTNALIQNPITTSENVVIENVQQPPGSVERVSHPENTARIVYAERSGSAAHDAYEVRQQTTTKREAKHQNTSQVTLSTEDPHYQRIVVGTSPTTVILPSNQQRIWLEFHIMRLEPAGGASASVFVQVEGGYTINRETRWELSEDHAYLHVRWGKQADGTRQWEIVGRSPTGVAPNALGGSE